MNATEALNAAQDLLRLWANASTTPEPNRLDVKLDASTLLDAVSLLAETRWGYLSAITGLDLGVNAGQLEVLYHFCTGAAVLTLRVVIDREHPVIPSICGVLPAAIFYERELREMLGVDISGMSNTDRLFLPDDWPDGLYPLRKDAVLD